MYSYLDIHRLSQDRSQTTTEIHRSNDFYGHASVLKNYLGIPQNYVIRAAIEHSVMISNKYSWHIDRNSLFPCIFTNSDERYAAYPAGKMIFAVGPYIHYAEHVLSPEEIKNEKLRLGKSLLVFPFHSTHHNTSFFDEKKYCDLIEELGKEFDSVRVCLYWQDVLYGRDEVYKQRGFECVTAGHIFDPLFLPRLKTIVECSTVTTSNAWGTHIGYSTFMGKPHVMHKMEIVNNYQKSNVSVKDRASKEDEMSSLEEQELAYELFSELRSDISDAQFEYVSSRWGFHSIREKPELLELFSIAEDVFALSKNYINGTNYLMHNVSLYYLLNSNVNRAAICIQELIKKSSVGENIMQLLLKKMNKLSPEKSCPGSEDRNGMSSLIKHIIA